MSPRKDTMAVLEQIVKLIPAKLIEKLKRKHRIQTRSFSAGSHVVALIYAQLSHSLSLNDICDAMRNHHGTLSRIRDSTPPSRNGLAHANQTRTANMAEDLFWSVHASLLERHPAFFQTSRDYPGLPRRFKRVIHAVDSTTIPLIAKCMDWAQHRLRKAAAKLHIDLNLTSFLPSFAVANRAKDSDPQMAWEVCSSIKAGEIVVFDKAYCDFKHLNHLDQRGVFWVTRAKDNIQFDVVGRQPVKMAQNGAVTSSKNGKIVGRQPVIISDSVIRMSCSATFKNYPRELRLVVADVWIDKKWKRMTFIANNFSWASSSICDLYQSRWGIEVFFKEIKQTLQLANFMGTSENAVRWQIWIALLTYLLLRFLAWQHEWNQSFNRLFTLIRGVLWNFFDLESVIRTCGRASQSKTRPPPPRSIQMEFDF